MPASDMPDGRLEVLVVPGIERAVGSVRHCFRDLMGPDHPARDDVLLCLTEVMTNALRHTRSGKGGKIRIEAAFGSDRTRVRITDDGGAEGEPRVLDGPSGESGRGLALVAEFADAWGFERADEGTTVWFTTQGGRGARAEV